MEWIQGLPTEVKDVILREAAANHPDVAAALRRAANHPVDVPDLTAGGEVDIEELNELLEIVPNVTHSNIIRILTAVTNAVAFSFAHPPSRPLCESEKIDRLFVHTLVAQWHDLVLCRRQCMTKEVCGQLEPLFAEWTTSVDEPTRRLPSDDEDDEDDGWLFADMVEDLAGIRRKLAEAPLPTPPASSATESESPDVAALLGPSPSKAPAEAPRPALPASAPASAPATAAAAAAAADPRPPRGIPPHLGWFQRAQSP
eukprot:GAFH01004308.1.p1 GENE.GAFH01004308.1~~GAFH01004308.1.p1  ORF type:complete len:257 (-),score=30.96 GAFH01004308.1:2-772(-)